MEHIVDINTINEYVKHTRSKSHTWLARMSFDEIFDLTAAVQLAILFYFTDNAHTTGPRTRNNSTTILAENIRGK